MDLSYINAKLCDAIYILAVDEGDARTRLAKTMPIILRLPTASFPEELQDEFDWVKNTINRGVGVYFPEFPVQKLSRIQNRTASKVIKKILFIQDQIDTLLMENFS